MKCVLYLRYSDDKQQYSSILGQRSVCESYCKKNDLEIIREYVDEGLSASHDIEKRDAFLTMIRDSKRGDFNAIVVYSFDRFSRDFYDIARFEHELEINNVIVLSATEINERSAVGRLTKRISQSYAVYYSEELAMKVQRGMNEHKKLHHYLGGPVPLGFAIENKEYILSDKADVVKSIFSDFVKGVSMFDIIRSLNNRGYTNTNGKPFTRSSLYSILQNEKYIGIYKYTIDGKDYEDDCLPHIVSDNDFYFVQERLGKRLNKKKRNSYHEYLLSGILWHDDFVMTGSSAKSGAYFYYECPTLRIRCEDVDSKVLGCLNEIVDDDFVRELSEMCFEESRKNAERESHLPEYESELASLKKSISKMLLHYGDDDFDDIFGADFNKARERVNYLKAMISQEKANQIFIPIDEYYNHFKQVLLLDKRKPEYNSLLIKYLVRSVVIKEKDIEIYLNAYNKPYKSSCDFSMVRLKNKYSNLRVYI